MKPYYWWQIWLMRTGQKTEDVGAFVGRDADEAVRHAVYDRVLELPPWPEGYAVMVEQGKAEISPNDFFSLRSYRERDAALAAGVKQRPPLRSERR